LPPPAMVRLVVAAACELLWLHQILPDPLIVRDGDISVPGGMVFPEVELPKNVAHARFSDAVVTFEVT